MNVGITRASHALWLLGNAATLSINEHWRALFEDARTRGCVIEDAGAHELFPNAYLWDGIAPGNPEKSLHAPPLKSVTPPPAHSAPKLVSAPSRTATPPPPHQVPAAPNLPPPQMHTAQALRPQQMPATPFMQSCQPLHHHGPPPPLQIQQGLSPSPLPRPQTSDPFAVTVPKLSSQVQLLQKTAPQPYAARQPQDRSPARLHSVPWLPPVAGTLTLPSDPLVASIPPPVRSKLWPSLMPETACPGAHTGSRHPSTHPQQMQHSATALTSPCSQNSHFSTSTGASTLPLRDASMSHSGTSARMPCAPQHSMSTQSSSTVTTQGKAEEPSDMKATAGGGGGTAMQVKVTEGAGPICTTEGDMPSSPKDPRRQRA
jgi:hypothetical protein